MNDLTVGVGSPSTSDTPPRPRQWGGQGYERNPTPAVPARPGSEFELTRRRLRPHLRVSNRLGSLIYLECFRPKDRQPSPTCQLKPMNRMSKRA